MVSAGQSRARNRQADRKPLRSPIVRDFTGELSLNRRPSEDRAKAFRVRRGSDRGSAALRPCKDDSFAMICAVDFDLPLGLGKRAIFSGICREFMEQKR